MKVTLAIVFLIVVSGGFSAAQSGQSSPPQNPSAEAPQQTPPQPGTPPCAQSKDTCEISEPAPQQPAMDTTKSSPEGQASNAPPKPETKKTTKVRRHRGNKKTEVASDATGPKKIVVRQGGTSDPNVVLAPGTTAKSKYSQQATADLLSATDANLKEAASRPLNANQEETVSQIRVFIDQANAAIRAGDLDRGHNLAIKAHLLSDDLVKH